MTTKDAQRNIRSIKKAIDKNGQITHITRAVQNGPYAPDQLKSPEGTPLEWDLKVAPIRFGTSNVKNEEVNTNTINNQQYAYIAGGQNYTPLVGDVLNLDVEYRITEITNDYVRQGLQCCFLVRLEI